MRVEILNEWFFPVENLYDENGRLTTFAPKEAINTKNNLRNTWLKKHPKLPHEIPLVSLGPKIKNGQEGYSVRTEIIYR